MNRQEMARQAKLGSLLLRTMIRRQREHVEICKTVVRLLEGRDSMSQAEREKFEGFFDVLKLLENAAIQRSNGKGKSTWFSASLIIKRG